MTQEQLKILRQIRKTMIVLIAMTTLGKPTGETELSRILEVSNKLARAQLDSLEKLGLVVRRGRYASFELTGDALELGLLDPSGKLYPTTGKIFLTTGEVFPTPINIINDSVKDLNRDSPESIKTIKTLTRANHYARGARGKIFPSFKVVDKPVDKPVDNFKTSSIDKWEGIPPDLAQAFREVKLMPNDRTRALAQEAHITPDYVRAIYRQLAERGMGSQTGLLVVQLEANMPAPNLMDIGHIRDCTCAECSGPDTYKGWTSSRRDRS
jgi:DNA-binding IscR family transcriptional regulator